MKSKICTLLLLILTVVSFAQTSQNNQKLDVVNEMLSHLENSDIYSAHVLFRAAPQNKLESVESKIRTYLDNNAQKNIEDVSNASNTIYRCTYTVSSESYYVVDFYFSLDATADQIVQIEDSENPSN